MTLPDYPLDEKRVRALVALYNNTRTEINRYRDYEWRITSYTLALLGACIGLGLNEKFRTLWSDLARWILIVLVLLIGGIAIFLVLYFHGKFVEHRKRRKDLDEVLGFSVAGMFTQDNQKILVPPTKDPKFATSIKYSVSFVFLILLTTILTIVVFVG